MMRLLALLFLWPGLVFADARLVAEYGPVLEKCYYAATEHKGKTACIGAFAQTCMQQEDGGETTLGMSTCAQSASKVWDRLLNREYARAKNWAVAMDEQEAEHFPEFANRVKRLLDAQRAWISFRDTDCALAYAIWGSGSMRHIAGSNCFLQSTAERTIELWAIGDVIR